MVIVGQQTELPVRLVTAAGANATGIVAADILNGVAQFVKSNNTKNNITLSNGSNWLEIDSVQSPGLYHMIIPFVVNSVVGPIQYTIYPTATAFTAFVGADYAMDAPAKESTSTAIKAKTDLIPASPASETTLAAVKAKTDNLPATPASQGDVTGATTSIKGAQDLSISTIAGGTSFVSNTDNLHAIKQAIAGAGSDPWASLLSTYTTPGTMGYSLRVIQQVLAGKSKISLANDRLVVYDTDGITVLAQWHLKNSNGNPSIYDITQREPV